jgi:outer membrane protein assembly factor BamB
VWDPFTDRLVWEIPADSLLDLSSTGGMVPGTKILSCVRDADELVYVTVAGRSQVIDIATGTMKFDIPLEESHYANLNKVEAFRDRERYYFSLQHPLAAASNTVPPAEGANKAATSPSTEIPLDSCFSAVRVEGGDLVAAEQATGRMLWSIPIGRRSVFHFPDLRLPVLLLGRQVQIENKTVARLDVVDARSGEIVARHDELPGEKMLHMACDPDTGQIILHGSKIDYRIDFGSNLAQAGR